MLAVEVEETVEVELPMRPQGNCMRGGIDTSKVLPGVELGVNLRSDRIDRSLICTQKY